MTLRIFICCMMVGYALPAYTMLYDTHLDLNASLEIAIPERKSNQNPKNQRTFSPKMKLQKTVTFLEKDLPVYVPDKYTETLQHCKQLLNSLSITQDKLLSCAHQLDSVNDEIHGQLIDARNATVQNSSMEPEQLKPIEKQLKAIEKWRKKIMKHTASILMHALPPERSSSLNK